MEELLIKIIHRIIARGNMFRKSGNVVGYYSSPCDHAVNSYYRHSMYLMATQRYVDTVNKFSDRSNQAFLKIKISNLLTCLSKKNNQNACVCQQ